MFRDRSISGIFVISEFNEIKGTNGTPKIGDIAELIVDKKNLRIDVKISNISNDKYEGEIVSYQAKMRKPTPKERLKEIQEHENFIETNNIKYGSIVKFTKNNIFFLSR